ncbi:MAG TPA: DNA-directed RNA polymerase subunit delta [Microscillaceae bacterium]|nr:DNA-directed RNA polymerase subunit delta [Microscillaceae bacterium]
MNPALVLMTDFGTRERFVASMKGVAYSLAPNTPIFDLTHDIAPFNIWEASRTLAQTISYWPSGTVFVSVVDPGVGTNRSSVVALTKTGHIIVTPENGTLSQVDNSIGIKEMYVIDQQRYLRPGAEKFHTFHGRDLYVYVGALLASKQLQLAQVGQPYPKPIIQLQIPEPEILTDVGLQGTITGIEHPYGNIISNIPYDWLSALEASPKQQPLLQVKIQYQDTPVFNEALSLVPSFGFVAEQQPLIYGDSEGQLGLAVNQGNFAQIYNINFGEKWILQVHKIID